MHRPSRQHAALKMKLEQKLGRTTSSGNKAKRWKKWIEEYEALCRGEASENAK